MNNRVRAHIEIYEPGKGWTSFCTLPLDDEQQIVLGDRLMEDLTQRLSAQVQPKNIALLTGADLWSMPDEKLREILESEWRCVAYFALINLIPELYTAIEVRFGEQFVIEIIADVLSHKGHDGEAFRQISSRRERVDMLARLNQETIQRQTPGQAG